MQSYTSAAVAARRVIAFDAETFLIRPSLLAPPPVCMTWREVGEPAKIVHHTGIETILGKWLSEPDTQLVGHNVAYDIAVVMQAYPHLRPAIFEAYNADRVTDTLTRQHLIDIACGCKGGKPASDGAWIHYEYSLEALARRLCGMRLQKDAWRLSYAKFVDTPIAGWDARAREVQAEARVKLAEVEVQLAKLTRKTDPARKPLESRRSGLIEMINSDPSRATEYALEDATATLGVYQAQEQYADYLHNQFEQVRGDLALHLSSAWGIRTDEKGVEGLREAITKAYDELESDLIVEGLVRNDRNRTRDTWAAKVLMREVCDEQNMQIVFTDGHFRKAEDGEPEIVSKCLDKAGNPLPHGDDACVEHVSLAAGACEETEHPVLKAYAEIGTLKKVLSNDIELLSKGIRYPVHTRYGRAGTGRTTSSKPALQNLCTREGIRECFIARPGMAFVACDYPTLEAFTWAQCCKTWLGVSSLGEALNKGIDTHLLLGATILGIPFDEIVRLHEAKDPEAIDIRKLAKVGNFGLPGGMGAETFQASCKKQLSKELFLRLRLDDLKACEKICKDWETTWTEAKLYASFIKRKGPAYPNKFSCTIESLFTRRFRGGAAYCAARNTPFQGLGADCAKRALWLLCHAQYNEPNSPLYNTRTVAFVHDEIIIEAPLDRVHEAGEALADVMTVGANTYLPDVPIPRSKVKPVAMIRWSKKASPTYKEGRLVPWDL